MRNHFFSDGRKTSKDEISQTSSASKLSKISPISRSDVVRGSIHTVTGSQTSPTSSPRVQTRSKHARCRANTTCSSQQSRGAHRKSSSRHVESDRKLGSRHVDTDQVSLGSVHSDVSNISGNSIKYNGGQGIGPKRSSTGTEIEPKFLNFYAPRGFNIKLVILLLEHLKFWNYTSICIPVRSLQIGRQNSN